MIHDHYNLIVMGFNWDVYHYAFRDFIENPNITYIQDFPLTGIVEQLRRLCFNPRLNKKFSIPFKSCWTSLFLKNVKGKHNCFLIMENWLRIEHATHLLPYLRSHYPESKIIVFTQDLVERVRDLYTGKTINVDYVKRYSDLFITYDHIDAEKYNLTYHPTVYSSVQVAADDTIPYTDLFFLGRDKGRLGLLVDMCNQFTKNGLKCCFFILDVPPEQQIECLGIHYIDHPISYKKNLQYVSRTKCIVELLQPNARSATFRMWEAIVFNKKLLTNNPEASQSPFYHNAYISVFKDWDEIDFTFVHKGENKPFGLENPFKCAIRPETIITFIEQTLNIHIER